VVRNLSYTSRFHSANDGLLVIKGRFTKPLGRGVRKLALQGLEKRCFWSLYQEALTGITDKLASDVYLSLREHTSCCSSRAAGVLGQGLLAAPRGNATASATAGVKKRLLPGGLGSGFRFGLSRWQIRLHSSPAGRQANEALPLISPCPPYGSNKATLLSAVA
jgi:hypothetical protein